MVLLCLVAAALYMAVPALYRSFGLPWMWGKTIDATHLIEGAEPQDVQSGVKTAWDDVEAIKVSCYSGVQARGSIYTRDQTIVAAACNLLKDSDFTYWKDYGAFVESERDLVGGYQASLSLLDARGRELLTIQFNGLAGKYYVLIDSVAYSMNGDTGPLSDALDMWTTEAATELNPEEGSSASASASGIDG
ncbi:hypothetical protein B5F33_03320 [Collinsella sp. An2]|nr:hypothetical protein B5F33_03320 [Collinsella sp. An2]